MSAAHEFKQQPTENDIDRAKQTSVSAPISDLKKLSEEDKAKLLATIQSTEDLSSKLQISEFILITTSGILAILAIGAIIFYALDWAASIFDFALTEYTQWLILM
eukprot:29914_1